MVGDIIGRDQTEEALRDANQFNIEIVSQAGEGIIVYDRDLRYVVWNRFMERMTGALAEDVLGRNALDLFPHLHEQGVDKLLKRALNGETVTSPDIQFYSTFTDQKGWVVGTYAPHRNARGEIVGVIATLRDVTERKQAEDALRESEQRLTDIIDFLPDATFAVDREGKVIAWNRAIEDMTGIPKEEMVGKSGYAYAVPFFGEPRPILIDLVLRDMKEIEKKYYFFRRNGDQLIAEAFAPMLNRGNGAYLWGIASPLYDSSGSIVGAIQSIRDITERKRTEKALLESEERYRAFFKTSRDCVFITSVDGRWVDLNDAAVQFFGYDSREDLLKVEIKDLYANSDERIRHLQVVNEKGYTQEYPVTLRKKDGTIINTLITSVTRKDSDGRIIGYQGTIRDITERKQAEEALRASHQIIEGIINAIPVRVFWKDRDLVYLGCNAIFAHDAGFADPKDIVGKDDYQMGWRDQAELYRADDRQVIESGRPKLLIEEPQTTPEGNTIVLLTSKIPLRSSEGEIIGVLGTYMDITERKRAEEALQESEERFKAQYQGSPAPTFTWQKHGADFVLVDFNEAAKAITDGKVSEFVGLRASDLYADRQEILRDLLRCHDERKVIRREIRSQNFVPGALVVATFASVPPDLVLVHLEDITERKRIEEELRQSRNELEQRVKERTEELARKNTEMERFIYTVSHDLRTPLISVSGFLGFLKQDAEKGDLEQMNADLRIANEAVTNMDQLLHGNVGT